jgi:hypothetical protein
MVRPEEKKSRNSGVKYLVFQSRGSVDTSQVQGLYLNEVAHKFSCAKKISNKSGAMKIFLEKVSI